METSLIVSRLREVLPADGISIDPRVLLNNSQDYAWFSNVLEEDLGGCRADVVVWPANDEQLAAVLATVYGLRIPLTVRGAGTGNYGQCVPLRGGVVLHMSRLNQILDIGDGYARVQAGVKFVELDQRANESEQEIRIYPSTYLTATVAGFVAGGSGGIGSVTHGVLADGNVLEATVYGVHDLPQPQRLTGTSLASVIHAYGTTGVLADVTVPLSPRMHWEQAVFSFSDIITCHEFCLALIDDDSVDKRLVCTAEPGVVRHFTRSRLPFSLDRSAVLLQFGTGQFARVQVLATQHRGQLDFVVPEDARTRLSDFSWNHTTLWAKKADDALTYLQAGFDIARYADQVRAIKAEYGDDVAIHGEYFRSGGAPFAGSLPIVAYKGRAYLDTMVEFFENIGVGIANPHRYVLEEGSRVENVDQLIRAKREFDPAGLLNPGKFRAAMGAEETAGHHFKQASMSLARQRQL